ncbi:MAG: response regulator [Nitrospirae bacterium]|nr:response regulator [Nitrospirota bacterium]NTW67642.1 response regulator [Nitrospirota bacterium]
MRNEAVLIVDDNKIMRDTLQGLLEAKGYSVSTCEDAPSALLLAGKKQFDIVLADYQLPQMNGDEMVCLLRQQYPDVYIIGFSLANKKQAFLEAGADKFIRKEHIFAELLRAVENRTRNCVVERI